MRARDLLEADRSQKGDRFRLWESQGLREDLVCPNCVPIYLIGLLVGRTV